MKFEWDERKNRKNIIKHGISFENAAFVFSDIDAITLLTKNIQMLKIDGLLLARSKIYQLL